MISLRCFPAILACALGAPISPGQSLSADAPRPPDRHLLATYSWGTTNIGDIAIMPGFLSLLREVRPDLPMVVMTIQGESDSRFPDIRDYLAGYLPDSQTIARPFNTGSAANPGRPGSAWRAFQDRWGASKLRALENGTLSARTAALIADDILNRLPLEIFDEIKQRNPEAARAFTDAGFVMYTSGMVLNFGRSAIRNLYGYTVRNAMSLMIARSLGIPYGINGHSFESIDWPADLFMRPLLQEAQFVYCRDPDSVEFLRQLDIHPARSGFRPDTTFFFQGFDDPWAEKFMRTHGLEKKRFITLFTRAGHSQQGAVARTVSFEREQAQMETIRGFIEEWIQQTGVPVVLAPEVKREIPWMRQYIYDRLPPEIRRKCVFMDEFWTTEQAYSLFRETEMVVSMEMHSVIMALSLGTPALLPEFIDNGRKGWMLGEMNLPDWHIDIDEPDSGVRLLNAALRIHRDHDAATARIQSELPRLRRLGIDVVNEIEAAWRH